MRFAILLGLLVPIVPSAAADDVLVSDAEALQRAVAGAKPGATIRVAPGTYRGGLHFRGLQGEPGRPIVLKGADPENPPVISGGGTGLQLSDVEHIEVSDFIAEKASDNGINIDDGGSYETPSHHVVLKRLIIREIGPAGNHDGIKLSGVDDFRVEGCTIERWGDGGSGIDMVGCHRGEIVGCTFRNGDERGANGVQAKGGSGDVAIRRCRFEHAGSRAVNIGGSTGLPFFRPRPEGHEARAITVEGCTFLGSHASIAFVGADESIVRRNTFYRPVRYVVRILQETREPGFAPCRNGVFEENLIAFRSGEMTTPINIGDGTAPETFRLRGNAWFCLDNPARSRPRLPIPEADGVYGRDPQFANAEEGDLRLRTGSPASHVGAQQDP